MYKKIVIWPHDEMFGTREYELLAKLMNWDPKNCPLNIKEIRVNVELDVEEVKESE